MPTTPKPVCQPQRSAMTPPSTTPSTEPIRPAARKAPRTVLRMRIREHAREQCHADRAVGCFADADDRTRDEQVAVAVGERAGDRRQAPDQRHQEDALDAAPAIGEQRKRDRADRNGDGYDRHEPAELAVRKRPVFLEMREHRHDDLAIDVIDDHQRKHDRENRPRIATWRQSVLGRVVLVGV